MVTLFSARNGLQARKSIQLTSMDKSLRAQLSAVYFSTLWPALSKAHGQSLTSNRFYGGAVYRIWTEILGQDPNRVRDTDVISNISHVIDLYPWHTVYDLLEISYELLTATPNRRDYDCQIFILACNEALERAVSGYRFRESKFIPITNSGELDAIDDAVSVTWRFPGAQSHLQAALMGLANRTNPNFGNVVHESLMALEALCREITGEEKSLGKLLAHMHKMKVTEHSALIEGMSKIYGYASDVGGIRHAAEDEKRPNSSLATWTVVTVSALISLLVAELPEEVS